MEHNQFLHDSRYVCLFASFPKYLPVRVVPLAVALVPLVPLAVALLAPGPLAVALVPLVPLAVPLAVKSSRGRR